MNFDILDSEKNFEQINHQWQINHDTATFNYVGEILQYNKSLWHTNYGKLYQDMCRYFGYDIPPTPIRVRDSNYIIVIYKRYD